jgi:hypothetical protein
MVKRVLSDRGVGYRHGECLFVSMTFVAEIMAGMGRV